MTQQNHELEQIKAKIQDHLISSGNYDKINKQLKLKLFETGWYDNVTRLTVQELEDADTTNFDELFAFVKPKAEAMVPAEVKAEVVQKIREYLEDVIQ